MVTDKYATVLRYYILYAFSCVGVDVAFVLQYSNSSKGSAVFYGELLYSCSAIVSVFVIIAYFIDEIVTIKSL